MKNYDLRKIVFFNIRYQYVYLQYLPSKEAAQQESTGSACKAIANFHFASSHEFSICASLMGDVVASYCC